MASVEDRVGQLLRAAAPQNEGVDVDDVVRRVRRRRNARWSGAGLVAVVGAAAGVVLLTVPGEHRSKGLTADGVDLTGTVPWADLPAQPYEAPSTSPSSAPPIDARACTAADVSARFDGGDGATGHLLRYVAFRNTSRSPCVLTGFPTTVTATEPGKPDVVATHSTFFPDTSTANMAPGGTTRVALVTQSVCRAYPGGATTTDPYHHVGVALPGGGTVPLDAAEPLDLTCGLEVTHFYVEQAPAPEPHDPLSDLQASLELPSSVAPGTQLVYVVALTNPTDQPIELDRCPSYVVSGNGLKDAHQLNCPAAAPIGPGRTERFEMRLPAAGIAPPGPLTLSWQLAAPFDVSAQGTLPVA